MGKFKLSHSERRQTHGTRLELIVCMHCVKQNLGKSFVGKDNHLITFQMFGNDAALRMKRMLCCSRVF